MSDTVLPDQSRSERLTLRRRRLRIAAITLTVVGTVCGGAVWLVGSSEPAKSRDVATPKASGVAVDEAALPELRRIVEDDKSEKRTLTHDDPLRVWVGGDSLAGALGPSLGNLAGASGVVATEVDYKVSSGLADDGVRDWSTQAEQAMATSDPEVVVFIIGTNDASIVNSHTLADGTPEWEPAYRVEVARMMDLFVGGDKHRSVFWIGAPPMQTDWRDEGVVELNRVMQEEAEKRAPDVVFVDAYRLFSSPDGGFTYDLQTFGDGVQRVRIGDGVHLTGAGADHLAAAVLALLDAQWRVWKQADTDNPIGVDTAQGGESSSYDSDDDYSSDWDSDSDWNEDPAVVPDDDGDTDGDSDDSSPESSTSAAPTTTEAPADTTSSPAATTTIPAKPTTTVAPTTTAPTSAAPTTAVPMTTPPST